MTKNNSNIPNDDLLASFQQMEKGELEEVVDFDRYTKQLIDDVNSGDPILDIL